MARLTTIRWFENEWSKDVENIEAFFRLVEEKDKRFRDACMELKVPYTLMHKFVKETPGLRARYDALLEAKAHDLMERRKAIADGAVGADQAGVSAAKLQCEVYEGNAKYWDKHLYGDADRGPRVVPVTIQIANLRGETHVQVSHETPAALPASPPLVGSDSA